MPIPKSQSTSSVLLEPAETRTVEPGFDLSFLDPPFESGDLGRIAHYRVTKVLGVGGMGVVLKAEDTHLRRTVALKVMRPEYIESYTSRERFLQEARVAAQLESEYIATVYQVGMHNDVPFLAMQFLQGEALDVRLEDGGALRLPDALLVARQAGVGLSTAHHLGLVHRDVKPANIWLEYEPNGRTLKRAKVLDFGLARVLDSSRKLTNMGTIIGTPQFMAPEQASGYPADARADIFSLGSVLYTMLTGQLPFIAPTAPALLMALISYHPPRVRQLVPTVPREIDDLIHRMMAKEPAGRPQSMVDVIDTIDLTMIEMSGFHSIPRSGAMGFDALRRETPPPAAASPTTCPSIALPTSTTVPVLDLPPIPAPPSPPPVRQRRGLSGIIGLVVAALAGAVVGYTVRGGVAPNGPPTQSERDRESFVQQKRDAP